MYFQKIKKFLLSKSNGFRFLLLTSTYLLVSLGLLLYATFFRLKTEKSIGLFIPLSALAIFISLLFLIMVFILIARNRQDNRLAEAITNFFSSPKLSIPFFLILCNLFAIELSVIVFLNIRLFGKAYLGFLPMLFLCFSVTVTSLYFLFRQSEPVSIFCRKLLNISIQKITLLGLFLLGSIILGIELSNLIEKNYFPTIYVTTNTDPLSFGLGTIVVLFIFNSFIIFLYFLTKTSPLFSKILNSTGIYTNLSVNPLKVSTVLISFLISAFFFISVLLFFPISYETNDDILMIQLLSGYIGGVPLEFPVFSNVILGIFFKILFHINDDINWVVYFYITVNFFSLWGLVYCIIKSKLFLSVKIFGLLVIFLFDAYFLTNLTYTTIAACATISGLIMVIPELLEHNGKKSSRLITSFVLIIIGCLIRIEAALMVFVLIFPLFLLNIKRFINRRSLQILVFPILLVSSVIIFNTVYLMAHPDWEQYYQYNKNHQQLRDTPRSLILDENPSFQKSVRWSENDRYLFFYWVKFDQQVFSNEKILALVNTINNWDHDINDVITIFVEQYSKKTAIDFLYVLLASLIVFLLTSDSNKLFTTALLTILSLLLICFTLAWGYKIPNRVCIPLFFIVSIIMLSLPGWFHFLGEQNHRSNSSLAIILGGIICVIVLLIFSRALLNQLFEVKSDINAQQRTYTQLVSEIDTQFDQGIFSSRSLILSPDVGFPFRTMDPFSMEFPKVSVLSGGWNSFSPAYEAEFVRHGFSMDAESFIDQPDFYLGTRETLIPKIELFYLEHYGLKINCEIVHILGHSYGYDKNTDPFVVFKLVSQ